MSLKLGNTNIAGTQVLYSTTGNNTDGAMTQAATTTQLNLKANDADVVHKTGNETISGEKTFTTCIRKTTSTSWENIISMTGNNFPYIAGYSKDNDTALALCTFHNGNWCNIEIHNSGTGGYVTAPASDINGSIITTVSKSKAENGYFKLGNGLIVQWGRKNTTSTSQHTISFSTPFSSATSYTIVKNYQSNKSTNCQDREVSFYNMTTTGATSYSPSGDTSQISWLAIGY